MQPDFWHMGGYAAYIWPSYGMAGLAMLWLLGRAMRELHHAEKRLKQLQSVVSPATEKNG